MRGLRATARNAFAEAISNRAALGSSMGVMIVNDVVWVAFWVLFFRRVGDIRGWDGDRVLLLLSVITSAAGISLGLLANARKIGIMAVGGELDAVLSLPVSPLAYVLLRRVEPINIGDLLFGLALFASRGPSLQQVAVFVLVVLLSATLLTSFLVLTGSTAFFAGRSESGELGFQAMILLGSYPVDVFAGMARVVLYSVVPAAFVSSVPAKLIDDFDVGQAATLAAIAAGFALAGWATFTAGLRRYTSGAVWTRA